MIRRQEHRDDLDGSEDAYAVRFAFDGTSYLIFLADGNHARLRQTLAPWVIAARRLGKTHRHRAR